MASTQQASVTRTIRPYAGIGPISPYRTCAAQKAAYRMTTPAPATASEG